MTEKFAHNLAYKSPEQKKEFHALLGSNEIAKTDKESLVCYLPDFVIKNWQILSRGERLVALAGADHMLSFLIGVKKLDDETNEKRKSKIMPSTKKN